MILLDTNVVSAVMAPAAAVIDWLDSSDTLTLFLSTITIAEIGYGIRVLPAGRRRQRLEVQFEKFVSEGFEHRLLTFDEAAAHRYAEVMGHRKEIGRPLSIPDGQIASIARARGFAVATRNTRDFEACGIELVNPFENAAPGTGKH